MSYSSGREIHTFRTPRSKVKRGTTRLRTFKLITGCIVIILASVVLMNLETPRAINAPERSEPLSKPEPVAPPAAVAKPSAPVVIPANPAEAKSPSSDSVDTSIGKNLAVTESDFASLKSKGLLIPVAGVTAEQLRDSFYEGRSEGRMHQALDIMAPQGTPVIASADGKVKLYTSERGGIMIYVTDLSAPYVYYYGHLQRYAEGIYDGRQVLRGEIIAYVGDTGNAGPGNYHLHFGISKVATQGKWSGGEPINPYPLLTGR